MYDEGQDSATTVLDSLAGIRVLMEVYAFFLSH
jgi:hypothetical protein